MPSRISKIGRKLRARKARKSLGSNSQSLTVDPHLPPYSGRYNDIQRQCYYEYNLAWNYRRPKILKWLIRLKLYNNQRRDENLVGEPLMYDVHQGIMAILYNDKLGVDFKGRTEDSADQGDNLNLLAENDYDEMEKDKLDYEWDWDASFFGSGYCLMSDFDTESKTPIPTIIDPTTFVFNPGMKWVNGNRAGEGKMLYGGYEVRLTESMMRENAKSKNNPDGYFNLNKLQRVNDLYSLSGESERLRRDAQGLNDIYTFENSVVENYEFRILRWFTHIPDPVTGISSKYIIELANNRTLPIRVIKLDRNYWPIVHRKFSPMSHDPDGVSVPDLTEDKQRYKAKILNTAGEIAQADVNGMYLFHEERFRRTQDFNFKFGKWIPVKGQGALKDAAQPLQTKQVSNTVQFILNYLDNSAQKATALPDTQQGQSQPGDQTLGEVQIQTQGVANRHSLTAKVYGWSEKEFWRQWYFMYDEYFADELGKKIAILEGPFGTQWIPIKRSDIISGSTLGPKIKIEAKSISESQNLRLFQMMQGYVQMVAQDPRVNLDTTYTYRKMGRLIMPKQEVERIIPLSSDEEQATEENDILDMNPGVGKIPRVIISQDHNVHLRVHANAADNPATRRHIKIHQHMLMMKRMYPQSFPQLPGETPQGGTATPGSNGAPVAQPNPMQKVAAPPEGLNAGKQMQ